MKILLAGVVALFGVIIGSFLNVCIYRIPQGISVVRGNGGRSMCQECGKTLKWYDLVPVFSYILLKGKCRYCKSHISFRYPLVELANSILWGLCAYMFGLEWKMAVYCVFSSILLVLAMIDWDIQEIPYRFQIMIICLGIVSIFLPGFPTIKERLIGAVVISVPMMILTLLMNGFGGGDIQLMAVSGFLLGWKANVVAMLIGTVLAGVIGFGVLRKKKINQNREEKILIPFGPFLAIGLMTAVFWGERLMDWYLTSFS